MAPHSSTLAWKIPWAEKPGRLQSMGSQRVGHYWTTSLSLFTFMHWRRKWQPTPVFLPGESQGRRSRVGCHLWGRTESDTTEMTEHHQQQQILESRGKFVRLFASSFMLEKRGKVLNELEIIISQTIVAYIPKGMNACVWYKLSFLQTEWLRRILRQSDL